MFNDLLLKLHVRIKDLLVREEGQNLVEYALVLAILAFGALASTQSFAIAIKAAFRIITSEFLSSI